MNTKLTQALEAVIPEAAKAPPDYSCSDMGNALRFIAQHGTKVLYCFTAERWYVWNGIVWREDRKGIVTAWAKATVNTIEAEAEACGDPDRAKELLKHSRASQAASRIRALLELARDHVPIEPDELDADQDLLNCQNGQLDLRTGILSPHAPDQLCTKITRASYLPDAPCTVWPAFLARIFAEDDDLIGFVQRLVGYGVTGSTAEQCLAILHGGGANGKSTFANAVSHVLGDYSKAAAPSLLTEQRSGMDRHPTEVADLKGCRLAVCQESGESGRLPETRVKQLTGGDPIKARHMGKDFFEFQPTHKLWLCTNHRPAIRGTDLAIWRRILLVPFEVTIPPEERDPRLEQKLKVEADGILAWAVAGCMEWRRHGLQPPEKVRMATSEYRENEDVLLGFIQDCCLLGEGMNVTAADLYEAYRLWCAKSGLHPRTQKRFGEALTERGFNRGRTSDTRTTLYSGLGLKQSTLN